MATAKRIFRAEATPLNAQALGATAESFSSNVDLETDGYMGSHVTVSVTFHGSGAQNVVVAAYGSLDGTNFDTIPMFSQEVAVTAGVTKMISLVIQDLANFRIGAKHKASEANVATVTVKEQAWRFDIS
jgi:fructose-specific phosphotransferase system component IIB